MDAALSGKILKQARQQVQELEDENEIGGGGQNKSSIQKKTVRLGEAPPDSDTDDDEGQVRLKNLTFPSAGFLQVVFRNFS